MREPHPTRLPPTRDDDRSQRRAVRIVVAVILIGSALAWAALLPLIQRYLPTDATTHPAGDEARSHRGGDETGGDDAHHIWLAVIDGDIDFLSQAEIDAGPVNRPVAGMTALMKAASLGRADMVRALLRHGADPNTRGMAERTALQYAAERDHIQVAEVLLDAGAEIDGADISGLTPLIMCADRGHTDFALMLMRRGADVNARMTVGWTPLLDAAHRGNLPLASALIAAGADTSATINGHTMVSLARLAGHDALSKYLESQ